MKETLYRFRIPISIALITDVHNNRFNDIVASLRRHNPDIITIVGDLVNGNITINEDNYSVLKEQRNALPLLRECCSIAPTFMSLGNHEWILSEDDFFMIKESGVVLLDNEWKKYRDIYIGGLTSDRVVGQQYELRKKAYIEKHHDASTYTDTIFGNEDVNKISNEIYIDWMSPLPQGYKLILCHHPEYYDFIPPEIDLILCGHAHGGQIRLFNQGLYAPDQGVFPKYTSGIYYNRMIVSRGLSNTTFLPRLFNPTEIVYVYSE